MNLEEELNVMESTSTPMTQQTNTTENIQQTNYTPFNMQTVDVSQYQQVSQNQPAMVNISQAQQQASEFNFANLQFDINKPQQENNGLPRLGGQTGESFRLHILPVAPLKLHVHTHYDSENRGSSFICLKDVYSTSYEPCCTTHGYSKPRNVIPVLVYPIMQGNINALLPGAVPELKVLIINDKKLEEIKQAAVSVLGVSADAVDLDKVDIIARVDNPQYKSHVFNCTPNTLKSQVVNFIPSLVEQWTKMATTENILRGVSTLLSREEYLGNPEYANYDFRKHLATNTPTQGVAPASFTFNTQNAQPNGYPFVPNGMQPNQPFYGEQNPFYNGQPSTSITGNLPGNNGNPWMQ